MNRRYQNVHDAEYQQQKAIRSNVLAVCRENDRDENDVRYVGDPSDAVVVGPVGSQRNTHDYPTPRILRLPLLSGAWLEDPSEAPL